MCESKQCSRCGEVKALGMFRWVAGRNAYRSRCLECERVASLAAYHRRHGAGVEAKSETWPRQEDERAADFALRNFRVVRPVAGVFAPSLGVSV